MIPCFCRDQESWTPLDPGALGLDALREARPVLTTMKTAGLLRGWCKGTGQVQLALGCGSHFIGMVPVL